MNLFEFLRDLHKDPRTKSTAILYSVILIAVLLLLIYTGVHFSIGVFEVNNNYKKSSKDSADIGLLPIGIPSHEVNKNPYWIEENHQLYNDTSHWVFVLGVYNFGKSKAYNISDSIVMLWQHTDGTVQSTDTFDIIPDFRSGFNRSESLHPKDVLFLRCYFTAYPKDLRRKFIAVHVRYTDEYHKNGLYAPIFDASDLSESGVIPLVSNEIYEGIDAFLHNRYNW